MAMRGFELGTETDRMFADAEQKRAEREVGKTEFQQVVDASGTKPMTASEFAYAGASIAPITGDIIAYKEAPEDFERAYELIKRGYKEKDLVNLGLGAAFAGLVTLGLIPGIGFISRIGKNAAKDSIKQALKEGNLSEAADTMVKTSKTYQDKALINKKSETQLQRLAEARIKYKNLSAKERNKKLKRLNRPDNITVYHGSKGMQDKLSSDKDYPKRETYKDTTLTETNDSATSSNFIDADDDSIMEFKSAIPTRKDMLIKEGFQPYVDTGDGIVNTRGTFKEARGLTSGDGYHAEINGKDIGKLLSTSRDPNVSMSPSFTNPETITNADNYLVDGPIIENLIYAEIPYEKMKNMKPDEYVDMTNGLSKNKDVKKYLAEKYFSKTKSNEYGATMLPKSGHVEAELAVAFPEYFKPKSISDLNPKDADYSTRIVLDKRGDPRSTAEMFEGKDVGKLNVPEKVKAAKLAFKKADTMLERIDDGAGGDMDKALFPTQNKVSAKEANIYRNKSYDNIKNSLNSMAELAKYTSEFGARGSYDKFLQKLGSRAYVFEKLADKFPQGSEKYKNLKVLSVLANSGFYAGPKQMNTIRKGFSSKKALDNITSDVKSKKVGAGILADKQIQDYLKTDTNITTAKGVYNKIIKKHDGADYAKKNIEVKNDLTPREAKQILLDLTGRFNRGGLVKQKGLMARA